MEPGIKRPVAIGLGLAVVIALAVLALVVLRPRADSPVPADVTTVTGRGEIDQTIRLTHLQIFTSTNFLGQRIYTVTATLKNISDKPVRLIDVKLTFSDYDKKVIREEERTALDVKHMPVDPAAEFAMAIPFENPPSNWNYHVPDTEVVLVGY